MSLNPKPSDYYAGCNLSLLRAVPASARLILDVGCAEGQLGAALKAQNPTRRVFGIEREPEVAARASARLDRVFTLDLERDDPPLGPGSLDCILYGDVLEHLYDPLAVLRRHRPLLAPEGVVLCSIPNVQHHSLLTALLTGDWQYTTAGLLDATHVRFFSHSTAFKLLLDAGFAPQVVEAIPVPAPPDLLAAAGPLLRHLGLHPGRTARYLNAYQYIVRGTPLADPGGTDSAVEEPLTFVACVSDEMVLQANLLASPCLKLGSPHEVLRMPGCPSAAAGLNAGLARARHRLVVCVHQDVYLPAGWPQRFQQQWRLAEARWGRIGVAGVYGVTGAEAAARRLGRVVDRDRLLWDGTGLPAAVDTLDELLLAVPKEAGLAFDPRLGFHLYGADICLEARRRGLAAVALEALCLHNSKSEGLPESFGPCAAAFAAKWRRALPLASSCVQFDAQGHVRLW